MFTFKNSVQNVGLKTHCLTFLPTSKNSYLSTGPGKAALGARVVKSRPCAAPGQTESRPRRVRKAESADGARPCSAGEGAAGEDAGPARGPRPRPEVRPPPTMALRSGWGDLGKDEQSDSLQHAAPPPPHVESLCKESETPEPSPCVPAASGALSLPAAPGEGCRGRARTSKPRGSSGTGQAGGQAGPRPARGRLCGDGRVAVPGFQTLPPPESPGQGQRAGRGTPPVAASFPRHPGPFSLLPPPLPVAPGAPPHSVDKGVCPGTEAGPCRGVTCVLVSVTSITLSFALVSVLRLRPERSPE